QVRDCRHVDHALGPVLAEHVLGGPLSDVDLVLLDGGRRAVPAAPVDAEHLVARGEQPLGDQACDLARDSRHEDLHARSFTPRSMRMLMRSMTRSTCSYMTSSSSGPVPSKRIGSPYSTRIETGFGIGTRYGVTGMYGTPIRRPSL